MGVVEEGLVGGFRGGFGEGWCVRERDRLGLRGWRGSFRVVGWVVWLDLEIVQWVGSAWRWASSGCRGSIGRRWIGLGWLDSEGC